MDCGSPGRYVRSNFGTPVLSDVQASRRFSKLRENKVKSLFGRKLKKTLETIENYYRCGWMMLKERCACTPLVQVKMNNCGL